MIKANAYRDAEQIRGEGDAEATRVYADAFNQDPEFYEFWKAIEAYRTLMPRFRKTLTTDAEFFKYLYNQDGDFPRP